MQPEKTPPPDPLDLEAFRRNAHALVDWVTDYLAGLGDRPVREPVEPGEVRAKLPESAPEGPEPFDAMLADLDRVVVPGLAHWQHPGWFAFFPAQTSPPAVLGELAAAGIGVQGMLWSTSPAATELESHVVDWLVDLLDVPQSWKTTGPGGGLLQAGASTATHTAMVVAREQCRERTGAPVEKMVAYTSSQAHSSLEKGTRMTGFGHFRLLDHRPGVRSPARGPRRSDRHRPPSRPSAGLPGLQRGHHPALRPSIRCAASARSPGPSKCGTTLTPPTGARP